MKFPILNNYRYLDTARSGILYDELLSWRNNHDLEFLKGGSQFRINEEEFLEEVKNELGDLLLHIVQLIVLLLHRLLKLLSLINLTSSIFK